MRALRNQLWSFILLLGMIYEYCVPMRRHPKYWGGRWKRNPRET